MENKLTKIFSLVVLFVLGGIGVLIILPNFWLKLAFFVLFLFVLGWTSISGKRIDVNSLALITAYVLSVAQFGLHFFFRWPGWLILILTFFWPAAIFWLGFRLKLGTISTAARMVIAGACLRRFSVLPSP